MCGLLLFAYCPGSSDVSANAPQMSAVSGRNCKWAQTRCTYLQFPCSNNSCHQFILASHGHRSTESVSWRHRLVLGLTIVGIISTLAFLALETFPGNRKLLMPVQLLRTGIGASCTVQITCYIWYSSARDWYSLNRHTNSGVLTSFLYLGAPMVYVKLFISMNLPA